MRESKHREANSITETTGPKQGMRARSLVCCEGPPSCPAICVGTIFNSAGIMFQNFAKGMFSGRAYVQQLHRTPRPSCLAHTSHLSAPALV